MRRQIRRSVYETNSSSTHAICIAKGGYELKDHIDFYTGEYGWECDEYGDLDNKASYLITAILSMDKESADEKLIQLEGILDENEITYTIPELNVNSCEYGKKKHYYYDIGYDYIDHAGELRPWLDDLLSDSDKLFRYLFGDSFIVTGNDNDDGFRDRMLIADGKEETDWGTYTLYGGLKPEFNKYEIYEKGN